MRLGLGAVLLALVLTGCTATASVPPQPPTTSAVDPVPSTAPPEASASPAPLPVLPASHPTDRPLGGGRGCAPTAAGMPARALHAPIVDVDGDGRPDTEWAEVVPGSGDLFFGITTASGATVSASEGFAGGAGRALVVGRLANGAVAVITSETRVSPLWSFADCRLRLVLGTYDPRSQVGDGKHLVFYDESSGGAAGCTDGVLEGYVWNPPGAATGRTTITAKRVRISADGTRATVGPTRVVIRDAPNRTAADARRLQRYWGVSCGTAPVLRPTARPS